MDRGHTAVQPLLDEILANQERAQTGDRRRPGACGPRAYHCRSASISVLPTGALLATLAPPNRRRRMPIWYPGLLANHGFVYLEAPFHRATVARDAGGGRAARVFNGIPPYDLWEHPPALGKIPPHGSDAGSYLVGEVFGARIGDPCLKDVDGLYSADPKTNPDATFIPEVGAAELIAMEIADACRSSRWCWNC